MTEIQVNEWDRTQKAAWQEERRKRAWELKNQGWKQKDIAATLGVSEGTLSEWLKRGREQGVEALNAHPHAGGATSSLSAEQQSQIPALLARGAQAYGFSTNSWTASRVAEVIERTFGVRYHRVHVARLMHRPGWRESQPSMTTVSLRAYPVWRELQTPEHFVQFYASDEALLNTVSGFVSAGLYSGASCLVIATQAHREGLKHLLQANGLDLLAQAGKRYVVLDASETLAEFMVDGQPDRARFSKVVGKLIAQTDQNQKFLHIFGEMVALLWMDGKQDAAIALEDLWNELRGTAQPFSLFCAYPLHLFAGKANKRHLSQVCQHHSQVLPQDHHAHLLTTN